MEKIKKYINQIRGVSYKPVDSSDIYQEGYIPILRANNIRDGKINFDKLVFVKKEKIKKEQYLKKGDILICTSSGSKELVGKASLITEDLEYSFGAFCKVIRVNNELNPNYLNQYFQSAKYKNTISRNSNGANINNLRTENFDDLELEILPYNSQLEISNKLEKIVSIIEIKKLQIEELNNLIKSQFVEMFEKYKYEYDELIKLCNFIDYRGKTPTKSDNGILLITAKNVKNNKFSFEPREYFLAELYDSHMTRGIPKVGDVLFTTEAPLGNVCRIPEIGGKFAVGQRIITMQPYGRIKEVYLEYALLSDKIQKEIWKRSSGSTVKGIKSKLLEHIEIPVPPISEQIRFSNFVKQVDKQKFEIQKSLDEIQKLQESLMNKYFG